MTTLALVVSAWMALSLPAGVLLGRAMRLAGQRDDGTGAGTVVPDFIPADVVASVAADQRHRG